MDGIVKAMVAYSRVKMASMMAEYQPRAEAGMYYRLVLSVEEKWYREFRYGLVVVSS